VRERGCVDQKYKISKSNFFCIKKQAVPCLYDPKHRGGLGTKRFKTIGPLVKFFFEVSGVKDRNKWYKK
jgi:hypothetical protein